MKLTNLSAYYSGGIQETPSPRNALLNIYSIFLPELNSVNISIILKI